MPRKHTLIWFHQLRSTTLANGCCAAYTAAMAYRWLADAILLLHLAFVGFALLGGLLVLRYPQLLRWHLAALGWGVVVQTMDWICPLTPLENHLRAQGGQAGYAGGFLEHWISRLLYPDFLTLELRYLLALLLVAVNLAIYAVILAKRKRLRRDQNKPPRPRSNQA